MTPNILEIKINDTTPPERNPGRGASPRTPDPSPAQPIERPTVTSRDLLTPQAVPTPQLITPPTPVFNQQEQQRFQAETQQAGQLAGLIGSRAGLPANLTQLLFETLKPQGPSPEELYLEELRQQKELQKQAIQEAKELKEQAKRISEDLRNPPAAEPFDFKPEDPARVVTEPAPKVTPPTGQPAFDFSPEVERPTPAGPNDPFDFSPEAPPTPVVQSVEGGFDLSPGAPSTAPTTPKPDPGTPFDFRPQQQLPTAKVATPPPAPAPVKPPMPVVSAGAAAGGAAAGAGAAGAAGGAMALAGGPIGVALMAAEMVEGKINDLYAGAEKGVRGLGTAASQVAGNDGLGLMKTATSAATGAIESIPIVGKDLVRNFKLLVAAQEAYSQTIMALTNRGQQLAEYNVGLAEASAMAEVRKTMADLREANRISDSVSRLITAQSRIETNAQDQFARVKDLLARAVTPSLERIAGLAERAEPVISMQLDFLESLMAMNEKVDAVLNRLLQRLGVNVNRGTEQDPRNEAESLFEGLLGKLDDLPLGTPQGRPDSFFQERMNSPLGDSLG